MMLEPIQNVQVENYNDRAYKKLYRVEAPYEKEEDLRQKVWAVISHEFGPNVADVLCQQIIDTVADHVSANWSN